MNNLFKGLVVLNTIIVPAIIVVMFMQKKGHIVYVDSNKLPGSHLKVVYLNLKWLMKQAVEPLVRFTMD